MMNKKDIKDRTVKDIIVSLMGEDNADVFLSKIQGEYDRGITGDKLEEYARTQIEEFKYVEPGSMKLVVAVVAITVM